MYQISTFLDAPDFLSPPGEGAFASSALTGGSGGSFTSELSRAGLGGKAGGNATGSICLAKSPASIGLIGSTLFGLFISEHGFPAYHKQVTVNTTINEILVIMVKKKRNDMNLISNSRPTQTCLRTTSIN